MAVASTRRSPEGWFGGDTAVDILAAIVTADPQWEALPAGTPAKLRRLLERCLKKDRHDRLHHVADARIGISETLADLGRDAAAEAPGNTVPAPPRKSGFRTGWVAAAAIVILAASWAVLRFTSPSEPVVETSGTRRIESLAVLPLEDHSASADQAYFVYGMTEALSTELAHVTGLKVISRTSMNRYRDSDKSIPEIARELGVDALVEGSVLRAGDRVRITAQLIDGIEEGALWAGSYEGDPGDVFSLQREVAAAIAAEIGSTLTPQRQAHLPSVRTIAPAAHEALLRGQAALERITATGFNESVRYFEQALEIEPELAAAYVGLAEAYHWASGRVRPPLEVMDTARAMAQKALQLDDNLSSAHTALGYVHLWFDWDPDAGEREAERALEINPSSAKAHALRAFVLSTTGRFTEAVAEVERAQALDPFSRTVQYSTGLSLLMSREYERCLEVGRFLADLYPDFSWGHVTVGRCEQALGHHAEAVAAFETALDKAQGEGAMKEPGQRAGVLLAALADGLAHAGNEEAARHVLAELIEFQERVEYVCPYETAMVWTSLGEFDQAIDWFEKAYEQRSDCWALGAVDPRIDPIRSDPRFEEILLRVGHTPLPVRNKRLEETNP